jgi:hypothetical protein
MIKQSKVAPSRNVPMEYKFGVELRRNVHGLDELDKKNGNTKWADAYDKEI